MCGVFGASRITPSVAKILPILGWEMESRGKDSWGASDGDEIIRHIGPITDSYELPEDWERGIFHTRSASHGSPKDIENCHPFNFQKGDGSWVIGIHNGIVTNHQALNTKYQRDFKVDSKHIFANLANGFGVGDLEGYMALAWFEGGEMNFARANTFDLHIATLEEGELVFCSTNSPLQKACRMMGNPIKTNWKVEEYHHYKVRRNEESGEDFLIDEGILPFPNRTRARVYYGGTNYTFPFEGGGDFGGDFGGYNPRDNYYRNLPKVGEEICWMCKVEEVDPKKELICEKCLKEKAWVWGREVKKDKEVGRVQIC
jgi:hypothetical protein